MYNEGNCISYEARIYDPRKGSWMSCDQYYTLYVGWTPYQFGLNNPICFVDKDGNVIIDRNGNPIIITQRSDGSFHVKGRLGWVNKWLLKNALKNPESRDVILAAHKIKTRITLFWGFLGKDNAFTNPGRNENGDRECLDDGSYEYVEINMLLFGHGRSSKSNRFYGHSRKNVLAAIESHEFIHASDKEQIQVDVDGEEKGPYTFGREILTLAHERKALLAAAESELEKGRTNEVYDFMESTLKKNADVDMNSREGKKIIRQMAKEVKKINLKYDKLEKDQKEKR